MLNFFRRAYSALTGRGLATMTAIRGSRTGDVPTRGTKEFLEVYETSPWVRAVAGKTATAVGSTKWVLSRRDRGQEVTEHILLQGLVKPNPLMSGHQLIKISQLCLDLVGDSFWLLVRNGLGAPVEFYPIPPHWIAETPTPTQPSFRVSWQGWNDRIPDRDVFWMSDPKAADPYGRGTGLVRAQSDELETHEYASKHAKQIFWNRAIPEFVVMDEGAAVEDIDRHEKAFTQRLQGFWRWYKPYFVNRKLEFWQPQQMNLENLTMVPLMKHERDVIIQAWGFPPEQLGIVENSNRATIDGSDYIFESRLVKPRREFIRDCIQASLLPEYDPRLVLGFMDTVPEDKEHRLNVAKAFPWAVRMDEARAMIGLKPVGNGLGGSFMVPLNSYLTADPLDLATRPQGGGPAKPDDEGAGEDSPPAAPPKPPKKGLTRRQRAGLLRRAMATIRAMATRPVTLQLQQGDVHVAPAQAFFQPELRAELALPPQPAPVVQVDNHVNVDAPEPRPWDATVTRDGDGRMTSVTHTPARG